MSDQLPEMSKDVLISLMRYCHLPMYFKARINNMKLGDILVLGQVSALIDDHSFYGQAMIKKVYGSYYFDAIWTIPTKSNRTDIWTKGNFKILKGGVIKYLENSRNEIRHFALLIL